MQFKRIVRVIERPATAARAARWLLPALAMGSGAPAQAQEVPEGAAVIYLSLGDGHSGVEGTPVGVPDPEGFHVLYDASGVPRGHQVSATVSADGRRVTIIDPGVRIVASLTRASCVGGDGVATCTRPNGLMGLSVILGPGRDRWNGPAGPPNFNQAVWGGAGNDTLTSALSRAVLYGQDGDDTLVGDAASLRLHGGAGNDLLLGGSAGDAMYGGAGDDRLDGHGGNDLLEGSSGADDLLGGTGLDRVAYYDGSGRRAVTADMDGLRDDGGAGENDLIAGVEWIENYNPSTSAGSDGASGGDDLTGDEGANVLKSDTGPGMLRGLGGNDTLVFTGSSGLVDGGTGDDRIEVQYYSPSGYSPGSGSWPERFYGGAATVRGGDGDDTIRASYGGPSDLYPDDIACGAGSDHVTADLEDTVAGDCEVVVYDAALT